MGELFVWTCSFQIKGTCAIYLVAINVIYIYERNIARKMAKDEGDDLLPDKDAAKGFYAKYEPKEILGRFVMWYFI